MHELVGLFCTLPLSIREVGVGGQRDCGLHGIGCRTELAQYVSHHIRYESPFANLFFQDFRW